MKTDLLNLKASQAQVEPLPITGQEIGFCSSREFKIQTICSGD